MKKKKAAPDWATDRLRAIVEKHAERASTRVALAKPVGRPKAKGKNVLLLQEVHSENAAETWPEAFSRGVRYTQKDRGLAKKLIDEFGYDNVEKVLLHVITDWENVRMRYRLSGYPSIPLLWGYRHSLFPDILDAGGAGHQPVSGSRFVSSGAKTAEDELASLLDE
jgi:hypothetical protein